MGVDTRISLPGNVRIGHVAEVIGAFLGENVEKCDLCRSSHPGAWYVSVPTVKIENASIVECADINGPDWHFFYHFESGSRRLLMPRALPVNIALGKRLADFFGGRVDYNDCDDRDVWDYEISDKDDDMNCPEDGEPWQDIQQRIVDLVPLTKAEVESCMGIASYKDMWTPKALKIIQK